MWLQRPDHSCQQGSGIELPDLTLEEVIFDPSHAFAVLGGSACQEWVKPWYPSSHPNHNTMNDSAPHFQSEALLDNPIWNSLATRHAHLAIRADIGHGLARRYPAAIGPLSGVHELTSQPDADLSA